MTFEQTMMRIGDHFGQLVRVTIGSTSERGPCLAMGATGTLATGWDEQRLDAMHCNVPEAVIQAFGFQEAPEVCLYFDPSEFRDARVDGDRLTLHVGEDAEITFEPCVDLPTVPPGSYPELELI
jgi:hypothetical protein